jgi:glycosyltransferase involved in cell wall biosynthesis
MVVEAALAGVGRHVLDLCERLPARGHGVQLIYSPLRADAAFCRRVARIEGVRVVEIAMRRGPSLSDVAAIRAVRRHLRTEEPFDVLHTHSTKAGVVGRLASVGLPPAVVYTPNAVRSMDPRLSRPARALYGVAERLLAEVTDIIVTVSVRERRHLRRLGVPGSKLRLVPNAIEHAELPDRAEARRRLGLPADAPVVGFVGRLAPQKAPDVLLEAFAELGRRRGDVLLAVVGYGEMEGTLRQRARELGIEANVYWLGERPGRQSMPAFNVFALPSRYEGLPYTLLEARSAGLPLVTTPAAGAETLVEPGENGILVPPDRPDLLAVALDEVLGDPAARRRMGRASLARAAEFPLSRMVDVTVEVYRSAMERRSRR